MLNQSYAIEAFQAKFSTLTTIEAIKDFIKSDPRLELFARLIFPDSTWNAGDDTIMGPKALILPKIMISGELYESSWDFEVKSLVGLEMSFIQALRKSIATMGRVS